VCAWAIVSYLHSRPARGGAHPEGECAALAAGGVDDRVAGQFADRQDQVVDTWAAGQCFAG